MLKQADVLVVGGGISGLSAANILAQKGYSVILVDSSPIMGGCIETFQSKTNPKSFVEIGAHSCYNSYQGLIKLLGDDFKPEALPKLPFGQIENSQIKSWHKGISFLELLFSLPKMWGAKKFNKTIKEHFGMLSGAKNYQRILRHFFDAVACQDTSEFPSDALFKKRAGRNENFPRKFSHPQGLSSIIKKLSYGNFKTFNDTQVKTLSHLESKDYKWEIKDQDENIFSARKIVFATSAEVVQSLLKPTFPNQDFPSFEEHHFSSLSLVLKHPSPKLKKFSFAISLKGSFHSVVSGDVLDQINQNTTTSRSFTFHSRNSLKSENELKNEALSLLGSREDDIIESKFKAHTLPSYTLDHTQKYLQFKSQISDFSKDLRVIGNWIDGMSIEDCVQTAIKELESF